MRPLLVQIPQPCPERWDAMQPTKQGRFCTSCQKTVVDYTAMSDRELVKLLSQPLQSNCGRFRDEQLNRSLTIPNPVGVSGWQRRVALLTMGFFGWHVAQGQSGQSTQLPHQTSPRPYFSVDQLPAHSVADQGTELVVKGRVMLTDSAGNSLPVVSADVSIRGTGHSWQACTGSAGVFAVTIPRQTQGTELSIWITTADGLSGQATFAVTPSDRAIILDEVTVRGVKILPRADITGGGICVIQPPTRWQRFWRKIFRYEPKSGRI